MRTSYNTPEGLPVAVGEISNLPGCSQVAVFHSAFVLPEYRNMGYGVAAHQERLYAAKKALYNLAICTVEEGNTYQIKNLERCDWTRVWTFRSNKTGHIVYVYMRNL